MMYENIYIFIKFTPLLFSGVLLLFQEPLAWFNAYLFCLVKIYCDLIQNDLHYFYLVSIVL